MRIVTFILLASLMGLSSCNWIKREGGLGNLVGLDSIGAKNLPKPLTADDIILEKELLYDQHTLADTYPYKDTTRTFQWEKVRVRIAILENIQRRKSKWAILQNYKNRNSEAPLVRTYVRNSYNRVSDTLGVERYQSVPLYMLSDSGVPERYGRDGSLVKIIDPGDNSKFMTIENVNFRGRWLVPKKYTKTISDTMVFHKAIFVDLTNQNIATAEKSGNKWLIRSMNPATTGLHRPPYQQETPTGIFVVQEKKPKMIFLKDGSTETGGFAPWANRFTNGAYIHGVPVNAPGKNMIEFSSTLGTTPRSHMCVRNATSHAKFVYDWEIIEGTIIFVFN